jgi:hypothetical protein
VEEESRGLDGEGFKAAEALLGRSNRQPFPKQREREKKGEATMRTGGSHRAARERG